MTSYRHDGQPPRPDGERLARIETLLERLTTDVEKLTTAIGEGDSAFEDLRKWRVAVDERLAACQLAESRMREIEEEVRQNSWIRKAVIGLLTAGGGTGTLTVLHFLEIITIGGGG